MCGVRWQYHQCLSSLDFPAGINPEIQEEFRSYSVPAFKIPSHNSEVDASVTEW